MSRPRRFVLWIVAALAAAAGVGVGVDLTFFSSQARHAWPPEPCTVQGVAARCGTFGVREDRSKPDGRRIALNVVVVPAWSKATKPDAVTYLAGGPGGAATQSTADLMQELVLLNTTRDILLVDQRGTGASKPPHHADVTQYGTRMAMDDLEAVRAALGYRQLDVIGSSYGATAAQIYATLHPSSVRTLVLAGGTAIDVPFFGRFAGNAQRALDQLAGFCAAEPDCHKAFSNWERRFGTLVHAWNRHHVHGMSGDELASVVHAMLLDGTKAVSIPLVVSRAAVGDYGPLDHAGQGDLNPHLGLMTSIWCSEPWTGLNAQGSWGTQFDSYTTTQIAGIREKCTAVSKRAEPHSLWTLPVSSRIPVLALAGGADPQDPVTNLSDLKRHFPDSRTVVLPRVGHSFGIGGCVDQMMLDLADRGTTNGLNTARCDGAVVMPAFQLAD